MIWLFEINRKGLAEDYGASRRAVNRATKRLFEEIGQYWQEMFLPLHFHPNARDVYGYQPRQDKYKKYKRETLYPKCKAIAPDTDLVKSGQSRRDLERPAAIRAYPSRFSITMRADVKYFQMRPYKSKHPAMGKEVTTVTAAESNELARLGQERLPILIAEENQRTSSRKRL